MQKYVFMVVFMSKSMSKSGEGVEMYTYFTIKANSPNRAHKVADKWCNNLINKNPSLKLMYKSDITLVSREGAE